MLEDPSAAATNKKSKTYVGPGPWGRNSHAPCLETRLARSSKELSEKAGRLEGIKLP